MAGASVWGHICLSAGICGWYNPSFTISPIFTSVYLMGAPGGPHTTLSSRLSTLAVQTFVIKQLERNPPAQEVSYFRREGRASGQYVGEPEHLLVHGPHGEADGHQHSEIRRF